MKSIDMVTQLNEIEDKAQYCWFISQIEMIRQREPAIVVEVMTNRYPVNPTGYMYDKMAYLKGLLVTLYPDYSHAVCSTMNTCSRDEIYRGVMEICAFVKKRKKKDE